MEQVPVELATWAVGPGLSVVARATEDLDAGVDHLAVGTRLRDEVGPEHAAFALTAAETRRRARAAGVLHADDLVLTREALEQASHPAAAGWRAGRAGVALADVGAPAARPVQDRCAGTGGDAVSLATAAPVLAVERDPGRAVLARHRAAVLDADVLVEVGDALTARPEDAACIVHADADRRDGQGRRARTLADHAPPVAALVAASSRAAGRLLTVAPGVAWSDPDLPADAEVVFLQHGRDLLEAVLCTGAARRDDARARAVLLDGGVERHRVGPVPEPLPVAAPGRHLLLPTPALVRARLHDVLGEELGAWRVSAHTALLTADAPATSPWCTSEAVEAVLPARGRRVRPWLRARPDRRVEVVLHGVRIDVAQWLRDAGSPPTGPDDLRIHLVRRAEDSIAIVTTLDGRPG